MTHEERRACALNFSWVLNRVLAGSRGPRTDSDLAALYDFGIRAIVRLADTRETGLNAEDVEGHRLRDCYEPMPDWSAPSQEQLDRVIAFIEDAIANSQPVAVSCAAGYGRTGTVLACYFVAAGLPPDDAISELIRVRPCSAEILRVPGQRDAVLKYFDRRTANERRP